MNYIIKNLLAIDQLANTILNGYPDETLSARAHRQHVKGRSFLRDIINFIFFWQEDHCYEAYVKELERKQYPKEYR
jgi:hypothetical protein